MYLKKSKVNMIYIFSYFFPKYLIKIKVKFIYGGGLSNYVVNLSKSKLQKTPL